jgi:hypothetical protein
MTTTSWPKHKCPKDGCDTMVAQVQLACHGHWYSIPYELRKRIWAAYRSGNTERHRHAITEAIAFLNAKEEAPAS